MPVKTGLVILTVLFERIDRIMVKYGAAVRAGVQLGVTAGTLTEQNATDILAALASIQAVTALLKTLTGY